MLILGYDTSSVAHICNSMQRMTKSRSIERGEVDFRVGNNARVAALAVRDDATSPPVRICLRA